MEDERIIELFFSRSEQGIAEIKKKYGALCMTVAGKILRRREDAEECVNSAYLKLWNAIPPKRPERLRAYLCMTVRNTAIDCERRNKQNDGAVELNREMPFYKSAEQEFDAGQITVYLNEFLKNTEQTGRGIFVLRYYFNMSVKDIAKNIGISEHAVTMRLSRIKKRLRTYLSERGVEI